MTTATEIMRREVEVPCYLCGKGNITIKASDLHLRGVPKDIRVRAELEKFLLEKTKEWIESLHSRNY